MGDILDLSDKLRQKLLAPTKEDMQSYEIRTMFCEKRMLEAGRCDCNICASKNITVTKIIDIVRQDIYDLSVKEKTPMFYADVLEVFYASVIKLTDVLNKPNNNN